MGFGPSFRTFCFFFGVGEPNLSNKLPNSVPALSHPMASTVPFLWIGTCTDRFSKSGFPKLFFAKSVFPTAFFPKLGFSKSVFPKSVFSKSVLFFPKYVFAKSVSQNIFSQNQFFHNLFFPKYVFFQTSFSLPLTKIIKSFFP